MSSMFPEFFYTLLYYERLQSNIPAMVLEKAMGYFIDRIDFYWLLEFDARICIELASFVSTLVTQALFCSVQT